MKRAKSIFRAACMLTVCGGRLLEAQTDGRAVKPINTVHTFYLNNISQQSDGNEIVTAVRNILAPDAKVYFVPNQNALILNTTADQLEIVQKILTDLDRPKRSYRLTYTITESEGGKRIGVQHFALMVVSGQRTDLKQGSRVPLITGSFDAGHSNVQSQFTYVDVGLSFTATLDESVNGVRLRTKAEQSSIVEDKSNAVPQDPVIRQTVVEGTAILNPGKPLVLGSLDIPGSTRHQDVEVVMEVVK